MADNSQLVSQAPVANAAGEEGPSTSLTGTRDLNTTPPIETNCPVVSLEEVQESSDVKPKSRMPSAQSGNDVKKKAEHVGGKAQRSRKAKTESTVKKQGRRKRPIRVMNPGQGTTPNGATASHYGYPVSLYSKEKLSANDSGSMVLPELTSATMPWQLPAPGTGVWFAEAPEPNLDIDVSDSGSDSSSDVEKN